MHIAIVVVTITVMVLLIIYKTKKMKKIIFLAVVLLFCSCAKQHSQETVQTEDIKEIVLPIVEFADYCFKGIDDIIGDKEKEAIMENIIKTKLESSIGDTLQILYNLPMFTAPFEKYELPSKDVQKFIKPTEFEKENEGKFLVSFYSTMPYKERVNKYPLKVYIKAITVLDSNKITELEERKFYRIQGKFKGFLDTTEDNKVFSLPSNKREKSFPYITRATTEYSDRDEIRINLGTVILEDVRIEPFGEYN